MLFNRIMTSAVTTAALLGTIPLFASGVTGYDFEKGSLAGWKVQKGQWKVVKDSIGNKVLKSDTPRGEIYLDAKEKFKDFELTLDFRTYQGDLGERFALRTQDGKDFTNGYTIALSTAWNDKKRKAFLPKLYLYKGKKILAHGKVMRYVKYDKMLKLRIVVKGIQFEAYLDDGFQEEKVFTFVDKENTYPEGRVGLVANLKATSHFDNVRITREVVTETMKALRAYPFTENFENLPLGDFKSRKWKVTKDIPAQNIARIVEEKGRGKVLYLYSSRKAVRLIPDLPVTSIPYRIEFDLKVPKAKPQGGKKTLYGNLRFKTYEKFGMNKRMTNWTANFRNYCYTLSIPQIGKSHYKPTQSTGNDWGHVRIDVDGAHLALSAKTHKFKGQLTPRHFEYFDVIGQKGNKGFLELEVFPHWGYQTHECWIDNIKITLIPVKDRHAYKQRVVTWQELQKLFNTEAYKKVSGGKIPSEMKQIETLLKKAVSISANDSTAYQSALAELDQQFAKCSAAYKKYETAVFNGLFKQKNDYKPLDLSGITNAVPQKRLPAFQSFTPLATVENIPFWTSPVAPYIHQFDLTAKSAIKVPIGQKAKEIFLLMVPQWELDYLKNGVYPSVSATHNDGPLTDRDISVSGSSEVIHQAFQVEIRYADGVTERAVPLLNRNLVPAMDMGKLTVYSVRPTRDQKIASITLCDRMNDWAGQLYGITLGFKTPKPLPEAEKVIPAKKIKAGPGSVRIASDRIVLESPAYRFTMTKTGVLRFTELFNKYSARNFLKGHSGALLLTGDFARAKTYSKLKDGKDGALIPVKKNVPYFATWTVNGVKQAGKDSVVFNIANTGKKLTGELTVKAGENSVRMSLKLKNTGSKKEKVTIAFPLLKNIQADGYLLPLRNGILSDRALDFCGDYGSNMQCMMQMIAVWDKNHQASLSMRMEDTDGNMKAFRFYKADPKGKRVRPYRVLGGRNRAYFCDEVGPLGNGIAMGVQFTYFELMPGKELQLPSASINVHPGSWKEPLRQYANWTKANFKPFRPVPEKTRKVALSVTGGGLNEQSKPKSGLEWGGVDVVHLYHIHSADTLEQIRKKYIQTLKNTKKNLASRRVPIGHGIYAVEGSYLRTETKLFGNIGHKWSLRGDKNELFYFQAMTKDQVLICRSNPLWHKAVSEQAALIAGEVVPTWVYVDTIGVAGPSLCFAKDHNHGDSPANELKGIKEEMKATITAMQKTNPHVGLLTEGPGCDYLTQYRDGAWSSLRAWETINNPGNFMYFRYLFPTFKFIELAGDSVTKSKINYFNGVPVNIYIYRGEDRTTATLKPLVTGYRKYWDIFTCEDMEPDVYTGAARKHGIYMNRFGNIANKRVVFAIANWGHMTWRGNLKLDHFSGAKYTVATDGDKVLKHKVLKGGKQAEVALTIDPYEVMYIAVTKE